MADGRPRNLKSLQARIRNYSAANGKPFPRAQRLIGVLVVSEMLGERNLGVIKGGSNLEVRLGIDASRASSDLDVVRTSSISMFRTGLEDALATSWHGFTGRVLDRGPIGAPVPDAYRPHRMDVKLEYQGKPFGTITLEIAVEEVDGLAQVNAVRSDEGAEIFNAVGLPAPGAVLVLPLSQQIAQKLHACTTPDEDGFINDRAHDLVDLQLADASYTGTLADIRAACERLFTSRRRHQWPPQATVRAGWPQRYAEEAEGLDVLPDVTAAVEWTNDYIESLTHA